MTGSDGIAGIAGVTGAAGQPGAVRLSHAYIADGGMADDLARAVVCSASSINAGGTAVILKPCGHCRDCVKASEHKHPDIITVSRLKDKSGKLRREIIVEQIRDLKTGRNIESAYIIPNEAAHKAYIVNDAHTMNTAAQNAFLNLLEEPPSHTVFILKTANPYALLPTVRSRCIDLKAGHMPSDDCDDTSETTQLAKEFAAALGDNMLLTKFMFRLEKIDKNTFSEFIPAARMQLAQSLSGGLSGKKALAADRLLSAADEMLRMNVSPGHVSGMLCAGLLTE